MAEKKLEMKKCKECGKMFVPKSSRQQYCDDIHYRPCPVCGDLVEAKYLSDPARRCDKCKNIRSKASTAKKLEYKPIVKKEKAPVKVTAADLVTSEVLDKALEGVIPENDLTFEKEEILENPVVAVYAGKPSCGFKKGCTYIIKTSLTEYSYLVEAIQNLSEGEVCENVAINVSSIISFNQQFKKPVYADNDTPHEGANNE